MIRNDVVRCFFAVYAPFALTLSAHARPPDVAEASGGQVGVRAPGAGSVLAAGATALRLSHRSIAGIKLLGQQARNAETRVDPACIAAIDDDAAASTFEDYLNANFTAVELADLDAFHGSPVGIKYTSALVENTLAGGDTEAASVRFTILEAYKIMAFLASPTGSRLAYLEIEPHSNMDPVFHSLMPLLVLPCMTKSPEPDPPRPGALPRGDM